MTMISKQHPAAPVLALVALAMTSAAAQACSSCGCNLGSDWVGQGLVNGQGVSVDLRHDFVDQKDLRIGNRRATAADTLGADEVEQRTINRYTTATLNYNPDKVWGFSAQLPWVHRSHSTDDAVDGLLHSHSSSIGDARFMARYQGFDLGQNVGVMVGLKLPTGRIHERFAENGEPLDRSLQPGTGSTDALLGLYGTGSLSRDLDWFSQGIVQTALATRGDYRPGNSVNINAGLRYMSLGAVMPQLQLNLIDKQRDSGASADPETTGGRLAYVTPGVGYSLSRQLSIHADVQLPVYQQVHGLQLTPEANYSVGIHYTFR